VAGIIGARANGVGTIGVAPEATLYAVKVLDGNGSGALSWVAAGIDWAVANGMQVINMSLGATVTSQALSDAVAAAQAAGVLVVSAAGNSGCCNTVGYPARLPGSMAVGAVDAADVIASFSSTGPEVDVVAPGVAVRAPVPTGTCALCDPSGYRVLSGTSMATPHVAGVAALLMSRGRLSWEAWNLITNTARDLGAAGFDNSYAWPCRCAGGREWRSRRSAAASSAATAGG
jgi:subtilisin